MSSYNWSPLENGGVSSIDGMTGALTLVAGTGITIVDGPGTITISTTAPMSAITSINGDTTAAQTLSVGTAGTDFAIVDAGGGSHVFNLPSASATARGVVTTGAQTLAGAKTFSTPPILSSLTASTTLVLDGSNNVASLAYTPLNTDSTIVSRDIFGNSYFNNVNGSSTVTVSSGQIIAMNAGSTQIQKVTGVSTVTFKLPDATTLINGNAYYFNNNSTGTVTIQKSDGSALTTLLGGGFMEVICTDNSTVAGTWDFHAAMPSNSSWGTAALTVGGTISASNLSGTNTGDQTITLTGDVTGSGTGSFATTAAATQTHITSIPNLATVGTVTSGTWNATAIAPTYGGAAPATRVLYVDGNRTDTYTATGAENLPFKTIGAAITQIISNNDNSTHQYNILIAPFSYSETITLNSSTLYNLVFSNIAAANNGVQNVTVSALTSTSNNTQLADLVFSGITFNGAVTLTGDINNTNFASTQVLFSGCQFNGGAVNLTNVNNVNFYGGQIQGATASTWTNLAFGYITLPEGFIGGTTLHLVDNPGGNVPSQYTGNYVLMSSTKMYGTLTIDAGSECDFVQVYEGSTSNITNNGTIHSWSTNWNGSSLVLNSGSVLRTRGDVFLNAPTVNAGASFTYNDTAYNATSVATAFKATGATSGTISILPQAAAGTFNFNLPITAGGAGTFLTSQGGGSTAMTWTTPTFASSTLTNTHIFVGNGSNVATDVALSGDATLANTGALTLASTQNNITSAPNIATVGTITSGTWHATAVGSQYGGTGIDTHLSTGYPSISSGTWSVATAANTFITLFETVATTLGDILYGGTSGTPTRLAGPTSATKQFLTSTGTGSAAQAPAWGTIAAGDLPTITLTGDVTGSASGGSIATSYNNTVPVNKGGTGQTTYTDGQLLIGNTSGNTLTKATITAGTGVSVTNGNGSITIAATGTVGAAWNYTPQSTTYNAVINDYVVASGASFTITLPTAASKNGQSVAVQHDGTSLTQVYTIHTTSSQTILNKGTTYSNTDINTTGLVALFTVGETFVFTSDGSNWTVTQHETTTSEASAGSLAITASSAFTFTLAASASITAGTVYTSNGNTFTVSTTSASSTTLLCYGTGSPGASGTLTFVSGSPSGNRTFNSVATSSPAYGTNSYNRFLWTREGKYLVGRWEYSATGAGTNGTGSFAFYYPTGLLPDTTNMAQDGTVSGVPVTMSQLGEGFSFGSAAAANSYAYNSWNGTLFMCYGQGNGIWSSGSFNVLQSTSRWSIQMIYPVTGWLP